MHEKLARSPETEAGLLGPDDPPPFEIVNGDGGCGALLVCDHASRVLPLGLGGLGLGESELRRHVAWDIGAADLTRGLAAKLDAPAVLAGYSRLLVDCNRALDDPTSIVMISDGVVVPGNRDLDARENARRAEAAYWPYHQAIEKELQRFAARGVVPAIISVHSFTPVFGGFERPWHIGLLWDRDPRLAVPMLESLRAEAGLAVGDNEPYSGRLNFGYSMTVHGAEAGLAHVLIELRDDLIDTRQGAETWAALLASTLEPILSQPAVHSLERY